MAAFVEKAVTVEASTLYVNSTLAARDSKITLPAVTPATAEASGLMGTMNIPLLSEIESMEATVTKIGVDENAYLLTSPGSKSLMAKWVQEQLKSDGTLKPVGCMAELKCYPLVYSPELSIEVSSGTECEINYSVYEYKLTVDGVTVFHVNRLTSTLKVWDGKQLKDCSESWSSLL